MSLVGDALRRVRLVPSVQPRAAVASWNYVERAVTSAAAVGKLVDRNPDRALMVVSRLPSAGLVFISPFPSVNITTRGILLPASTLPVVIDFSTWGPVVGFDWYLIGSGVGVPMWVLEGIYDPKVQ